MMRRASSSIVLACLITGTAMSARADGNDAMDRIQAGDCKGAGDAINDGIAKQDALAYLAAGYLYDVTGCVAHDPARAARYYRRAAELGNADAADFLGLMYAMGNGVPQDYRAAYHAFNYLNEKKSEFKAVEEDQEAVTGYALAVTQVARAKARYPRDGYKLDKNRNRTIWVTFDAASGMISFDSGQLNGSAPFMRVISDAYADAVQEVPPLDASFKRDQTFKVPWSFEIK